MQGTINAAEGVEVQGTSTIIGDINTKAIAGIEGGGINGSIRITDSAMAEAQSLRAPRVTPAVIAS